jgi:hypothetical protein
VGWLADPQLARRRYRAKTVGRASLHQFLFGSEVETARQQMGVRGTEFGYSLYQQTSQEMHGNSFDLFVWGTTEAFAPRLLTHDPG